MNSYRVLAINRGEKAKILSVKILADEQIVQNYLNFRLVKKSSAQNAAEFVKNAAAEAYKRFLGPAIERELRRELTEQANEQAIKVFGENLYHLLMQAPIKGKVVLGFDPAYRTGCKLAVLDPNGKLLKVAVIYPHKPAPENQRQQAEGQLLQLIEDYQVEMIAIGNGTASRESERFVAQTIKKIKRPVYYVIVNESGASVYSASQDARDEFPELTVEKRSAISIGRRLQDPLAELVKISPEAIGVGQYQHDLPKTALKVELDAVVERAVNRVGVNLNTASYQLLAHIAGLNATLAKNIVRYRNENGRFTSRMQLKSVPRLGPKPSSRQWAFCESWMAMSRWITLIFTQKAMQLLVSCCRQPASLVNLAHRWLPSSCGSWILNSSSVKKSAWQRLKILLPRFANQDEICVTHCQHRFCVKTF